MPVIDSDRKGIIGVCEINVGLNKGSAVYGVGIKWSGGIGGWGELDAWKDMEPSLYTILRVVSGGYDNRTKLREYLRN